MIQTIRPWRAEFGVELRAEAGESISGLDSAQLKALLQAEGFVLLRGFQAGVEPLEALTRLLFERSMVYGGLREKVTKDDAIQTVDLGKRDLGLHSELAYAPIRPDLAVFHCLVPARDGGETTVGDGVQIYRALRSTTQKLLASHRVKYMNIVRAAAWRRTFKAETREQMSAILTKMQWLESGFDEEESLHIAHIAPALFSVRQGQIAYADSVHRFPATAPPDFT